MQMLACSTDPEIRQLSLLLWRVLSLFFSRVNASGCRQGISSFVSSIHKLKRLRTHYVLDGCTSWHTLPTGPARHRHEGTFAQTTKNNPAKPPGAQRYDIFVSFYRPKSR